MTRPLATLALVVSALVFLATLVAPDTGSAWPPPVQALSGGASVVLVIWLFAPWIGWLGRQVSLALRGALGRQP